MHFAPGPLAQGRTWTAATSIGGGGGAQVVELDLAEAGTVTIDTQASDVIEVTAWALAQYDEDPGVGPVSCPAPVTVTEPSAGTFEVLVTGFDPAVCDGISLVLTNKDWGTNTSTPIGLTATVADPTITFSEVPLGANVTDQYARVLGVVFGGDSPHTVMDDANPTSPVLSGTPRFAGTITIDFVIPGTDIEAPVDRVTLDAGWIDSIGGVTLTAFDDAGNQLTQLTTQVTETIATLTIAEPGMTRLVFQVTPDEPWGAAIDNVVIER